MSAMIVVYLLIGLGVGLLVSWWLISAVEQDRRINRR